MQKVTPIQMEQAVLAESDAKALEAMAEQLKHLAWANKCGKDGREYLKKAMEAAPGVLKRVVNYI